MAIFALACVAILAAASIVAVVFEHTAAISLADQHRGGFTLPIDYPYDGEEP